MDRPILFSAPMVCALLDGTKTQTRRIAQPQGGSRVWQEDLADGRKAWFADINHSFGSQRILATPYVGDRLWVREAWRTERAYDDIKPSDLSQKIAIEFQADSEMVGWEEPYGSVGRLRPGMFLPRWGSRITLEVKAVRVERLQDISRDDAIAEGIGRSLLGDMRDELENPEAWADKPDDLTLYFNMVEDEYPLFHDPRECFRNFWDMINEDRGYPWEKNPWVSATTFEVHKCNIGEM